VDRVLLHRVAEATVKDFLDRVGAAITDPAITNADVQAIGHKGRRGGKCALTQQSPPA
jgi:hypothetical protein